MSAVIPTKYGMLISSRKTVSPAARNARTIGRTADRSLPARETKTSYPAVAMSAQNLRIGERAPEAAFVVGLGVPARTGDPQVDNADEAERRLFRMAEGHVV